MPKIRKKTSNRQSTRLREKIKHKVAESKKKAKKHAAKDVTWKSRKEKDPGIPAMFPYKEQILQEVQTARLKAEEEKRLRKAQKIDIHDLVDKAEESAQAFEEQGQLAANLSDETDSAPFPPSNTHLKTYARSLHSVIANSDVIVQVLDARDPMGTRSLAVERDVLARNKKLVLVLNKIDLVPKEIVEEWLIHLRRSFPTLPFKSSTQEQHNNLSSSARGQGVLTQSGSSTQPLIHLLKNYSRITSVLNSTSSGPSTSSIKSKMALTVGIVGFPNVGKSSLINTLKRSRACGVAPTPGFTKDVQEVSLDSKLKLLDCPGVVLEGGDDTPDTVLRNAIKLEKIQDPIAPVELILSRCKPQHLMVLYNIPSFNTTQEFLIQVARSRGRLRKGGIPDIRGAARTVLGDWTAGRIKYYTVVPEISGEGEDLSMEPVSTVEAALPAGDAILTELAPEFDLDSLFKEADSNALAGSQTRKEMKSVSQFHSTMPTTNSAKLIGDVGEEMAVEEDPFLEPIEGSRKRKAGKDVRDSVKKRVSFGLDDEDLEVRLAEEDVLGDNNEARPSRDKAMKQARKKMQKLGRRQEKKDNRAIDELSSGLSESLSLSFKTSTGALEGETGYDFGALFQS